MTLEAHDISQDETVELLVKFGVDETMREELKFLRPLIEEALSPALERFYGSLRKDPALRKFFRDEEHMGTAQAAQFKHWLKICDGRLDDAYAERARRIGRVHARIGLKPMEYVGAYSKIINDLIVHASKNYTGPLGRDGKSARYFRRKTDPETLGRTISVLVRAMLVDMALCLSVYTEQRRFA